jgi:hypothetical protein
VFEAGVPKTLTVNAAFMREIKEDDQQLWHILRRVRVTAARRPASEPRASELIRLMHALRSHLQFRFQLEEDYGYIESFRIQTYSFEVSARTLHAEHRTLMEQWEDVIVRAESLHQRGRWVDLATRIPLGIEVFHNQLRDHEQRELQLVEQCAARAAWCDSDTVFNEGGGEPGLPRSG